MPAEAASPSAGPATKRSRQQAGTSSNPRAKRKKQEEPVSDDGGGSGKKDEDGELITKIDFKDLPDETLYKYLEHHDLLPTFKTSPWEDNSVGGPRTLYPSPSKRAPSPVKSAKRDESTAPDGVGVGVSIDDDAPTTRSKTAPVRKETPPRAIPSPTEDVPCLSDVQAARDVLAEKANAHWLKGLGGGQNKESETIVNFLYKMKVGPGRLLRVYNPNPSHFAS